LLVDHVETCQDTIREAQKYEAQKYISLTPSSQMSISSLLHQDQSTNIDYANAGIAQQ
jgi:hypothetical protein